MSPGHWTAPCPLTSSLLPTDPGAQLSPPIPPPHPRPNHLRHLCSANCTDGSGRGRLLNHRSTTESGGLNISAFKGPSAACCEASRGSSQPRPAARRGSQSPPPTGKIRFLHVPVLHFGPPSSVSHSLWSAESPLGSRPVPLPRDSVSMLLNVAGHQ